MTSKSNWNGIPSRRDDAQAGVPNAAVPVRRVVTANDKALGSRRNNLSVRSAALRAVSARVTADLMFGEP